MVCNMESMERYEIREHNGKYDLLDKKGKVLIEDESFTVVDRVLFYLEHPDIWDTSELCEVANSIREA